MIFEALQDIVRRTIRVLVIDDNADAADTLAILLELFAFPVRVAYDGPSGLLAAEEWEPGCVLLDIKMPGMDGYEVARRLRVVPALAGVKIIALSAFSDAGHLDRLAAAGFDHSFVKPADPHAVIAFLRSLV
jgi:CheY-like chemotaxis protein